MFTFLESQSTPSNTVVATPRTSTKHQIVKQENEENTAHPAKRPRKNSATHNEIKVKTEPGTAISNSLNDTDMDDISSTEELEIKSKQRSRRQHQDKARQRVPQVPQAKLKPDEIGLSQKAQPKIKPLADLVKDYPHIQFDAKTGGTVCALINSERLNALNKEQNSRPKYTELDGMANSNTNNNHTNTRATHDDVTGFLDQLEAKARQVSDMYTPDGTNNSVANDDELTAALLFKKDHIKAIQIDPWIYPQFQQKINSLPVPMFVAEVNGDIVTATAAEKLLSAGLRVTPLTTWDHDDELLKEAGKWMHNGDMRNFPPCSEGKLCTGMTLCIPGMEKIKRKRHVVVHGRTVEEEYTLQGVIFTQIMYRDEYNFFLATNTPPSSKRICLMCFRKLFPDQLYYIRSMNGVTKMNSNNPSHVSVNSNNSNSSKSEMDTTTNAFNSQNTLADFKYETDRKTPQYGWNLCDTEGGYYSEAMCHPIAGVDVGLNPVAGLNLSYIEAETEPSGRVKINQDMIKFKRKPLPLPNIGETRQDF